MIGHEAIGEVVAVGEGVKRWKLGDKVCVPFSTSCGKCFYCKQGYTARCTGGGALLGTAATAGAQAQYVRIPEAEACLLPTADDIKPELLLLMADILPTGYYAAYNARHALDDGQVEPNKFVQGTISQPQGKRGVAVVIGCGPVSEKEEHGRCRPE